MIPFLAETDGFWPLVVFCTAAYAAGIWTRPYVMKALGFSCDKC
jgi:hypothetical protein